MAQARPASQSASASASPVDPYWACHHPQTRSKLSQLGLSADLGGGGLGVRLAPSLAQVLGGLWGSWLLRDPQNGAQHRTRAVHTDTQPVVARRYRVNNPLVFRCRVLGTTPPRGGPVPAGENGSLLGKQSVVVLSEVTVIGTAPSHDGAVILDGSSVQCWVSTLSRRLG